MIHGILKYKPTRLFIFFTAFFVANALIAEGVVKPRDIGIITPFRAQIGAIKRHLRKELLEDEDFIIDTVSADHDINAYLNLLGVDGNLTLVGAPAEPLDVPAFSLIVRRRSFSGSAIGGIAETQEMLDFCGKHNITADVEVIPIQKVNEAYERLLKSDVKYRFSIDMASLKSE